MTSGPLTKKSGVEPGVVDLLGQTLQSYTNDLRYLKSKTDKQVTFENGLKNTAINTTSVQQHISITARQYIVQQKSTSEQKYIGTSVCQYSSTPVGLYISMAVQQYTSRTKHQYVSTTVKEHFYKNCIGFT